MAELNGPDFLDDFPRPRIDDAEDRRMEAREIGVRAGGIDDRIVRAGIRRLDSFDDVARLGIDHVPEVLLK